MCRGFSLVVIRLESSKDMPNLISSNAIPGVHNPTPQNRFRLIHAEFGHAHCFMLFLDPSFTAFFRSCMVLLTCTCEHFFLHLEQFGFAQTTCLHLVDPLFSSL